MAAPTKAKGKTALVTGATSGVGLATAQLLSRQGYQVVGTTSNLSQYDPSQYDFQLLQMDLSSQEEVERVLHDEAMKFATDKTFDLIILNAGIGEIGSIEDTPLKDSQKLFQINYWGHVQIVKTLLPRIRQQQSTLIFLGSIVYSLPFPFKAQYSASKAALSCFALALRQELRPFGVKVYLLEPGWIRSSFHRRLKALKPLSSAYQSRLHTFEDHRRDSQKKYPDGQKVAQLIVKLGEKKPRQTRWVIGPDAKLFFALRHLLPYRLFEKFFLDRY